MNEPATGFRALKPFWRVTLAAFLGWFLDAFDQVVLLLALPDIGRSLGVGLEAMGAVVAVQSVGRVIGNTGWGWLSDRYGRKPAFMIGIVWFAVFSALAGLAPNYGTMLAVQFGFGIGFGGEWTASAALLMESVPAATRPLASALMMAGYEFGFAAAAAAQALVLPHYGWRPLFFLGLLPALLALFVRVGVAESPVWLRTRAAARERPPAAAVPAPRRRRFPVGPAAVQAVCFMLVLQFQNASMYGFYPTLLREVHHFTPAAVFPMILAYSVGSAIGKPLCGGLSARFGERAVLLVYLLLSLAVLPLFVSAHAPLLLGSGAFLIGLFCNSLFALVPHYLSRRFASAHRSFGMGVSYAAAAAGQGLSGLVVPLVAGASGLARAIELCVIGGSVLTAMVAMREPAELPGAAMEGDGEDAGEAAPAVPAGARR